MKHIIVILTLVCLSVQANCNNLEITMKSANDYYSKNEYDKAISQYLTIINAGYQSKALYFNIGNAYFKTKILTKLFYIMKELNLLILRIKILILIWELQEL